MQTYNYAKEAAKNTPGLKPVADQLGDRFKKASRKKTSGEPEKAQAGLLIR